MMSEQEVKQLLIDTQAILEGHFLLTSGLHSPMYVEKFNVLQHPKYTETLCKELAERLHCVVDSKSNQVHAYSS